MIIIEYVWVDGSGTMLRSKTRTVETVVETFSDVPIWNYDGSSTGQADRKSSEVELVPVALFRDPFRRYEEQTSLLALCKTRSARDHKATEKGDLRHVAERIFNNPTVVDAHCWFGLEQEYVLIGRDTNRPLGWPADRSKEPEPQGPYYCSALSNVGHAIAEQHYLACLYAGVRISGFNAEVMLGQWEFQIGPCEGLDAGDHLLVARYILQRVCALHNCIPTLDPKPVAGDWNGSGLHTNFSTVEMRREPGLSQSNEKIVLQKEQQKEEEQKQEDEAKVSWSALISAVVKLQTRHKEHMLVYGEGNERRMTGDHETSSLNECTFGVGDRGASIRIGEQTTRTRYGYLEDRRPASSANPYLVTAAIAETTLLL